MSNWANIKGEFYAEVHHPADDIPGDPDHRTDFADIQEKNQFDNWVAKGWNQDDSDSYCFFNSHVVTAGEHFNVWSYPPNHSC